LLEGTVDFQFTDSRLSGTDGTYAWLVDSSNSDEFVVTLTPSSLGTISGQVVITGRKYSYGTAAVNSPITLQVTGQVVGTIDCNDNGVPDDQDILGGTSADCNANNVPDECEVPPLGPPSGDCNANGIPDVCDVPPIGRFADCNGNQIPDVCEPDCNGNGTADECDVPPLGTGADCNGNQTPDACELDGNDCNENGIPDDCDVLPPFDYGEAYWRFSTLASNIVEDEGSNNLDGTTNGRPYLSTDIPANPVPQNGFANTQSLNLNWGSITSVGYFTAPYDSALSMGNQSFTLEAWVKLDYLSGTGSADERQWLFMKKGNSASDNLIDYALLAQRGLYNISTNYGKSSGITGREPMLLFGTGSATWSITSHLEITDTDWHFLSVTFDPAGSARFGIDNTFQTETFTNGAHTTNTATLKVGVHTNASGTFNQGLRGSIDEMRISRGVRTLSELLNASGAATSEDVNGNGIPDECEDCNGNGILDDLDIAGGTSLDCQPDGIPDECQVEGNDCNSNGIPDECEGGFNSLDVFVQELLADSPNPALLCVFDLNHDGSVDGGDIQPFIDSIIP
jgi:hypothetical protein